MHRVSRSGPDGAGDCPSGSSSSRTAALDSASASAALVAATRPAAECNSSLSRYRLPSSSCNRASSNTASLSRMPCASIASFTSSSDQTSSPLSGAASEAWAWPMMLISTVFAPATTPVPAASPLRRRSSNK